MIASSAGVLCASVSAKPEKVFIGAPAAIASATRCASMSAFSPMKTAASPTRLWKPATSSGICVICTREATKAPTAPPMITIGASSQKCPEPPKIVAITASAMPAMPYQIARLAFSWLERPPSARMKRIAAAR